jgi:hypothetical protein
MMCAGCSDIDWEDESRLLLLGEDRGGGIAPRAHAVASEVAVNGSPNRCSFDLDDDAYVEVAEHPDTEVRCVMSMQMARQRASALERWLCI